MAKVCGKGCPFYGKPADADDKKADAFVCKCGGTGAVFHRANHLICRKCFYQQELSHYIGQKFSMLAVQEITLIKESMCERPAFVCKCDCGQITSKPVHSVITGFAQSCGCFLVEAAKAKVGDKNPNWRGGLPQDLEDRVGPQSWLWKNAVITKYGRRCQRCTSAQDLVCHHLLNFRRYMELRLDPENGLLLCDLCHREFHRKYGIKGNDPDQMTEFLGQAVYVSEKMLAAWNFRKLLDEGRPFDLEFIENYLSTLTSETRTKIVENEAALKNFTTSSSLD